VETNYSLTDRERDILEWLLDEGLTNKEIAETIGISLQSVKNSLRSAYRKIGVTHTRQLLPKVETVRAKLKII